MKKLLFSLLLTSAALAQVYTSLPDDENPSLFLEGLREVTSLAEAQEKNLNAGEVKIDLWSGSYWPVYQGSLAVRYRDSQFITLMETYAQWDKFRELSLRTPLMSYAGRENLLSPAEKYDLLVGDSEMSLTKYSWELGEKNNAGGKVKTWRGVCDGWASASQKMPRPVKTIRLKTPEGYALTFYPEDIKALGSLMYARSQGPVLFIGKRCPNRILGVFTGACAQTNPATFHRALLNRVGIMGKSFIADISPGGEVWNYPVKNYKTTYFNVFDQSESENFAQVMESFSGKRTRFRKSTTRDPRTAWIVGVKIDVNFQDMREANLLETDSTEKDTILEKTFIYDLELDRNFNAIGGESISKNLPDFIWAPQDSTYPLSDAEESAPELSLIELSRISARKGQPLARIIKELFELAK
jgi:hypothetical protein